LDQQPEHIDPALLQRHLDELFPDEEDALQRRATFAAARRCLTVLTGGPGTGKTTTVVRMLATLLLSATDGAPRIVLCAPTGKAAARMAETVRGIAGTLPVPEETAAALQGLPALTMHRLLGWRSNSPTRFAHDAGNPLPYDLVVVDEASMASLPMMARLFDALGEQTRLVLVGDRDQLTSVDAGAVFSNICGPSDVAPHTPQPTLADAYDGVEGDKPGGPGSYGHSELAESIVTLTRFHRFGSGSGIGEVARAIQRIGTGGASAEEALHLLRAGQNEEVALLAPSAGRHPLPRDLLETVVARYGEAVQLALDGAPATEVLEAFERIRILTALRRGPDGVHALNLAIERALASAIPGYAAEEPFPIGRPLLVTRNDHQMQLYNGDVGVVVRDPNSPARRRVAFPTTGGGVRLLAPARLPETEPVFAMSVHKSQGSQFGEVVLVLPREDSPLLSRELVYTGITRAEQSVTVLADQDILATALDRRVQRASGLTERLWGPPPY
jgi:exodeoxyribonuclease V alpha subunit